MQSTLMQQGVELMLFGMGTVFVFLALLVVATNVMSSLIRRFVKSEPVISTSAAGAFKPISTTEDQQLVAIISAAIHKYRSRH